MPLAFIKASNSVPPIGEKRKRRASSSSEDLSFSESSLPAVIPCEALGVSLDRVSLLSLRFSLFCLPFPGRGIP